MKSAFAYLRVSIAEETVENQAQAIQAWALQNDVKIAQWFEEEPVSGSIPPRQRPRFAEMLEACKANKPDFVVVYELSRVGRTFTQTLESIWALESSGVPLISISPRESFLSSLDPSVRKLILAILTWAAERERELMIERTRQGMLRAKADGKHVGRPRAFSEREISEMRDLYERKGVSIAAIAKLKNANYRTVYKWVRVKT